MGLVDGRLENVLGILFLVSLFLRADADRHRLDRSQQIGYFFIGPTIAVV
jgi:hypothetical protein